MWDPLALVARTTIELQLIIDLQELWSEGYSWDEILPEEIGTKWLRNIQILNLLLANRWRLTDGRHSCVLFTATAFVAPLKKRSIPRLELTGMSHVLQETLDPQAFKFIRSDVNPADVLTGRDSPKEIKSWTKGPRLYGVPKKSGLSSKKARNKSNKDRTTVCEEPTSCAVCKEETTDIGQQTNNPIIQHLIKSCSTKTLGYVLRFANSTRKKEINARPISPEELRESELQMFKCCRQIVNMNTVDKKLIPKPD
ncbi:hypothetical protein P5673_030808 [Acropora cervicornis]|uniref:Uncharacterized protein n=1 Tax=Acropora cervicornis TaxID=6130 RepID=A0AAD9UT07_ACRCE|nr:hypothetical protein P5673_030808 [Acropora cervicornis]